MDYEWRKIPAIRFSWEKYIGKVGFAVCQCVKDSYSTPLRLNGDMIEHP